MKQINVKLSRFQLNRVEYDVVAVCVSVVLGLDRDVEGDWYGWAQREPQLHPTALYSTTLHLTIHCTVTLHLTLHCTATVL